jgi:hypothetical protein
LAAQAFPRSLAHQETQEDRSVRTAFSLLGSLVGVAVVVVVVVAGLALLGTPSPTCADGPIAVSAAAEGGFITKWNAFNSTINQGGAATVTFSEEEVTSRGAGYLAATGVPAKSLQVHLCPGQGKGQASATMSVAGLDVGVVVTGHLELASKPSRIVVDSLQVGQVPEVIGTLVANRVLEAANITVSGDIREVSTTSTSATLKGQR